MSRAAYQSGFAAIVGCPNVGKSTLMNAILGSKVAIVTPKPQTTRNRIAGIATYEDWQVVFLDTPGIHEAKGSLNRLMVECAYSSLTDADVVCFMVDASQAVVRGVTDANRRIMTRLTKTGAPVMLILNKVDLVAKEKLLPVMEAYSSSMSFAAIIPVSARQGKGLEAVLSETRARLPAGEQYFSSGQLTDRSLSFILTEFIREKVFMLTRQEIPYAAAVTIDLLEEPGGGAPWHVVASIYVEKKSQKGMVIGKQGRMVKKIGQQARLEMESYLDKKVFLELHVRVEKDWTRSMKGIRKVGFET